ncbi:hypothetical protein JOD54_004249 [Actinokineospora baliensis]|uniref:hypothetical protein n=1 Tax=Actinokineospora baliensis TaxID=547056 RepID=UPI00195E1933|nr:hypothetical protein [Actinokineospora baliensis]MBM7774045.1 hypothetical protein [Actinokineospora baliensis]
MEFDELMTIARSASPGLAPVPGHPIDIVSWQADEEVAALEVEPVLAFGARP